MTSLLRRCSLPISALSLVFAACSGPSPMDAGRNDAGIMDSGRPDSRQVFPDGTVFCTTDDECDDQIDCTNDSCSTSGFCRNVTDPAFCDDGVFCNGVEQCDPRARVPATGCVSGERETCNDDNVCTIDRCNEETKSCDRFPRDQDGDGDADWFCEGGGDCDDGNPSVSSLVSEVCRDLMDNDCDEMVDEPECGRPLHDTCDDPLDVSAGGFFLLNTDGATPDYTLGCRGTTRDLVTTFTLTERRSVTITGEGELFTVALSLRTTCTTRDSEVACENGFPGIVRQRALDPGTYFVIVAASSTGEIGLTIDFGAPIDPAPNETCSAPIDVSAGGRFMASTVEVADDVTTACALGSAPDLVYVFTTTTVQDVRISALSTTGESMAVTVRTDCLSSASDMRCAYGSPAAGTLHQLPAGTYFIIVEGPTFRPVDFTLDVMFLPPTPPAAGDSCSNAISLTPDGTVVSGTFADKENDHAVSCGSRNNDAVYSFTLTSTSDVTIDLDVGGFANFSLRTTCDDSSTQLRCSTGNPVRERVRGLPAGTYYIIAESFRGTGFSISVDATPPTAVIPVTGNDNCASAYVLPASGGLFSGSTAAMLPDLTAACGGGAGSNDAVFALTLTARSRVITSTDGSSYDTVLHIHRGGCTSGGEIACDDDGGTGLTSRLDRMLDAGTYYIVVDGYGGASDGPYVLEVLVTP